MTGLDYMAVSTEHNFALLLQTPVGVRGKPWDADTWRRGDKRKIVSALRKAAQQISKRQTKAREITSTDLAQLQAIALAFVQAAEDVAIHGAGREEPRWVRLGEDAEQAHQLLAKYGV